MYVSIFTSMYLHQTNKTWAKPRYCNHNSRCKHVRSPQKIWLNLHKKKLANPWFLLVTTWRFPKVKVAPNHPNFRLGFSLHWTIQLWSPDFHPWYLRIFRPLQAFGRLHDPLRVQDLRNPWESGQQRNQKWLDKVYKPKWWSTGKWVLCLIYIYIHIYIILYILYMFIESLASWTCVYV